MTYDDALLEHFEHPRNVGAPDGANAEAEVENPVCGDHLHVWLRIEGGVIQAAGWRGRGCVPALAVASAMSEMVTGLPAGEAWQLERDVIAGAVGGVPARKGHAVALAQTALRQALASYEAH